ncbi:MAG TPA: hypothetical protein VJT69_18415 [Pyrinomonadaceae bacterium]|nr:hypothetical protein [Pyrinomonadaceae bacterium]
MKRRKVSKCVECGSDYFMNLARMTELCPECAHVLYGHEPCPHSFVNGRCSRCYWDGSKSRYIKQLKSERGIVVKPGHDAT